MNFNTFLIGLLVCFLLSFSLGLERQIRRRFIGLRTMILVAVGSYLFVSFSFLLNEHNVDVTRIAAQVVAGIGFLGAGVIWKDSNKNVVTGLTTAATLWCDASIGVLCAGGFIIEAIIASLVVLFSNIVLRYINRFIDKKIEDKLTNELYTFEFDTRNAKEISEYISNYDNKNNYIKVNSITVNKDKIFVEAIVKKNEVSRISKLVNNIVTEYDIVSYKYENISELKNNEDNE